MAVAKKAVPKELLDSLLADYRKPEDLIGENGLLKQLTRRLVEKALEAEMADGLGHGSKRCVASTSLIRPLKRSTIPFVCGVRGLVSRCSISSAAHSRSNSCLPLAGFCRLNRRSVNSLPLSVRMVRMWQGAAF